jgi:hypothetical protein
MAALCLVALIVVPAARRLISTLTIWRAAPVAVVKT